MSLNCVHVHLLVTPPWTEQLFLDWLEQCPVNWLRISVDDGAESFKFFIDKEEDQTDD